MSDPKSVIYDGKVWQVEEVLKPTKHDMYLVVSRKERKESLEEADEGSCCAQLRFLLDVKKHEFYPATPKIKRIMKEKQQAENRVKELDSRYSKELADTWYKFVDSFGVEVW